MSRCMLDMIEKISQIPTTVHPDDLDGFLRDLGDSVREYWALEKVLTDHLLANGHEQAVVRGLSPKLQCLSHAVYINRQQKAAFEEAGLTPYNYAL